MRLLMVVLCLSAVPSGAWAKGVTSPERVTCSIAAALKFRLPPELLLAVAEMEGGKPGQWVRNANGSHDVGPMQFNTRYLAHLERQYGITAADVAAAGCYPYEVAAWRLRRHLDRDRGDLWTRAANYHSRAPGHNAKYRRKLIGKAAAWKRRLEGERPGHAGGARKLARAAPRETDLHRPAERLELDSVERDLLAQLNGQVNGDASRSEGRPHAGALRDSVQVPTHPAYSVLKADRTWGSASAVRWLVEAFDALMDDGQAPMVQVHDMSLRVGGAMRGHRSHQSGRDVDITYFHRSCRRACGQRPISPDDLDATRQWKLLSHWIARGQLEHAFVDYALQKPLYEAARKANATKSELAHWFQYPHGVEARRGLIRHVPKHADHVHVRFRCNADDQGCHGQAASRDEAEDIAELLERLAP